MEGLAAVNGFINKAISRVLSAAVNGSIPNWNPGMWEPKG